MQVFGRWLVPAVILQPVSSAVISDVVQTTVSSAFTGRHSVLPWHHSYGSATLSLQAVAQRPDPALGIWRPIGIWSHIQSITFSACATRRLRLSSAVFVAQMVIAPPKANSTFHFQAIERSQAAPRRFTVTMFGLPPSVAVPLPPYAFVPVQPAHFEPVH